MQCDGGFARTGRTLNDEHFGIFIADDAVLLLLNGSDDVFHFLVGAAGQFFLQHFVVDIHSGLDHVLHLAANDAVLTFQTDIALDDTHWRSKVSRSGFKVVEHGRNGCTPVVDEVFLALLILKGMDAQIDILCIGGACFVEVDAPEIWGEDQLIDAGCLADDLLTAVHFIADIDAVGDQFLGIHIRLLFPKLTLHLQNLLGCCIDLRL